MSMKNPLTTAGIEPATFRFVTQRLNHCATAVPINYILGVLYINYIFYIKIKHSHYRPGVAQRVPGS